MPKIEQDPETNDGAEPTPDRWFEKDPENGQFTTSHLGSKTASAMSKKRWEGESADEVDATEAEANELLRDVGFDDPSKADASFRNLARKAVNSVAGMRLFLSQAGKLVRDERQSALKWDGKERRSSGEGLRLNGDAVNRIAALVAQFTLDHNAPARVDQKDEHWDKTIGKAGYGSITPIL